MVDLNYLKRLGLHGGRLGWRVLVLMMPVIAYSFFNLLKSVFASQADSDTENVPSIGSHLEAWEAFDQGKIGAAEMSYYDEVYGE